MRVALLLLLVGVAACGEEETCCPGTIPDGSGPLAPTANPAREILDTKLYVDVTQHMGKATITFGPSTDGASLEVGDLSIIAVTGDASNYVVNGTQLDLALPASTR